MIAIFEFDKESSFDNFHLTSCTKFKKCVVGLSNEIFI